jgi:hypothetical protein
MPDAPDDRFMTLKGEPAVCRHALVAYGYDVISRTGFGYPSAGCSPAEPTSVSPKVSMILGVGWWLV